MTIYDDSKQIQIKTESLFNRVNRFEKFESLSISDLEKIREMAKDLKESLEARSYYGEYAKRYELLKCVLYSVNTTPKGPHILHNTDAKFAYFIETIDPDLFMLSEYRNTDIPRGDSEEDKKIKKQKYSQIRAICRDNIGFSDLRLINYEIYYTRFLKRLRSLQNQLSTTDIMTLDIPSLSFESINEDRIAAIREKSNTSTKYPLLSKTIDRIDQSDMTSTEEKILLIILSIDNNFSMLSSFLNESNWKNIIEIIQEKLSLKTVNKNEIELIKVLIKIEKEIHDTLFKDMEISEWTI